MADILYALHDFEAENADELSFGAGEAIIVLERDDQYGDGWYQVRTLSLPLITPPFGISHGMV